MGLADQSEIRTVFAVATALWTLCLVWERASKWDRPQVRTPDGFVLRRTGGYTIYEPALAVDDRFQRKVRIEMI